MRKAIVLLFVGFLSLFSTMQAQDIQTMFATANEHYNAGAYTEAINAYTAILATQQHSAALYFNLGNAHYKLNQVAESIYFYEKALQLRPEDPDVLHNLQFAKNMTLDAIETLPQTQLATLQNDLLQLFSPQQWSYTFIVFIWLAVILFLTYLLTRRTTMKRIAFSLCVVFLGLSAMSYYGATAALDQKENLKYGILFSEEIQLFNEPNDRAEVAFVLHQGVKVQILDQLQDWQKIRIANGAEGWVKEARIRAL